jgi:hypothetical protein
MLRRVNPLLADSVEKVRTTMDQNLLASQVRFKNADAGTSSSAAHRT